MPPSCEQLHANLLLSLHAMGLSPKSSLFECGHGVSGVASDWPPTTLGDKQTFKLETQESVHTIGHSFCGAQIAA
jgi:hypothetical protein